MLDGNVPVTYVAGRVLAEDPWTIAELDLMSVSDNLEKTRRYARQWLECLYYDDYRLCHVWIFECPIELGSTARAVYP